MNSAYNGIIGERTYRATDFQYEGPIAFGLTFCVLHGGSFDTEFPQSVNRERFGTMVTEKSTDKNFITSTGLYDPSFEQCSLRLEYHNIAGS